MELGTVCTIRPVYFTVVFLLLAGVTVASVISLAVALKRRIAGRVTASRHLKTFHVVVVVVWLAYAAVFAIEWFRARRAVIDYERSVGRRSQVVREAVSRDVKEMATAGAICIGVGLLSMLAWRSAKQ
jgi:hypothetical protein